MSDDKIYGVADRAWQAVIGCDASMPCAPRCWARKTVARIVKCQEPQTPERAAFFQLALTPDGSKWSGKTFLDPARLADPLKWRTPGLVATGFHGDWGRLSTDDMHAMFGVMALCEMFKSTYPSDFMLLTKQPESVLEYLSEAPEDLSLQWGIAASNMLDGEWIWNQGKSHRDRIEAFVSACHGFYPDCESMLEEDAFTIPLPRVTIGCSVMNQYEADKYRPAMAGIAALGWRTHVWYEPAIGPVNWHGWEFLERVICGGETPNAGFCARPFNVQWARDTLLWCREHGIKFWMKQLGSAPYFVAAGARIPLEVTDRKGEGLRDIPVGLHVREEVEAVHA